MHRAGYVTIVGRPNVGKSTLLNALVGAKVAIVTPKPQTTRTRVVGIRSLPDAQMVFLDTPGIHEARSSLNRRMVDVARTAVSDADVLCWLVDATAGIAPADRALAGTLDSRDRPVVIVINKADRVSRSALLPLMAILGELLPGREVIPASARTGENVPTVLTTVAASLPTGPSLFPEEDYTTHPERFLVEECIREQLFLQMEEEIPYGTAVIVDTFTRDATRNLVRIQATILVDRPNHKGMVIGKGGQRLKEVGRRARLGLEELLGARLYLELQVRVESGWAENPRRLQELGL